MFCGVGVTDIPARTDGIVDKEYLLWTSLLKRCFDEKYLKWKPTYLGCSVSEDWLVYSNFKKDIVLIHGFGFDGWQLDKDILARGNKIYSKETCCFVPREVNQFFSGGQSVLGKDTPKGVSYEKSRGLYEAYGMLWWKKKSTYKMSPRWTYTGVGIQTQLLQYINIAENKLKDDKCIDRDIQVKC